MIFWSTASVIFQIQLLNYSFLPSINAYSQHVSYFSYKSQLETQKKKKKPCLKRIDRSCIPKMQVLGSPDISCSATKTIVLTRTAGTEVVRYENGENVQVLSSTIPASDHNNQ